MPIENSSLHLTSQRTASEQRVRRESLRVWVGARRPDFEGQGAPRLPGQGSPRDTVAVSGVGDAARQKKDPLVINFDATAAQLSDARLAFDLDADGSAERVPFVGPGSAFLALDRNGDGQIGGGGELFGPSTGNGFAELASYDQDRNGWIDENDPVYAQLLAWSKDGSGSDSLTPLKEGGVGAIYLGAAETQFDVKDQRNDAKGQVRSTSVYLREDGSAGTAQQIDLAT